MRWHEVVEKLVLMHQLNTFRVSRNDVLSEHDVVSRILRKDNYMVAIVNKVW